MPAPFDDSSSGWAWTDSSRSGSSSSTRGRGRYRSRKSVAVGRAAGRRGRTRRRRRRRRRAPATTPAGSATLKNAVRIKGRSRPSGSVWARRTAGWRGSSTRARRRRCRTPMPTATDQHAPAAVARIASVRPAMSHRQIGTIGGSIATCRRPRSARRHGRPAAPRRRRAATTTVARADARADAGRATRPLEAGLGEDVADVVALAAPGGRRHRIRVDLRGAAPTAGHRRHRHPATRPTGASTSSPADGASRRHHHARRRDAHLRRPGRRGRWLAVRAARAAPPAAVFDDAAVDELVDASSPPPPTDYDFAVEDARWLGADGALPRHDLRPTRPTAAREHRRRCASPTDGAILPASSGPSARCGPSSTRPRSPTTPSIPPIPAGPGTVPGIRDAGP